MVHHLRLDDLCARVVHRQSESRYEQLDVSVSFISFFPLPLSRLESGSKRLNVQMYTRPALGKLKPTVPQHLHSRRVTRSRSCVTGRKMWAFMQVPIAYLSASSDLLASLLAYGVLCAVTNMEQMALPCHLQWLVGRLSGLDPMGRVPRDEFSDEPGRDGRSGELLE